MRRLSALVGLIAVVGISVSAVAQEGPAATPSASDKSFVLAPHIGVTVPHLFTDLGAWPVFGLELGYIIPADIAGFRRPLQVSFDAMYTAPGASGTGTNPCLGEGGSDYQWELNERMVMLQVTGMWCFMAPGESLSAYALGDWCFSPSLGIDMEI